MTVLVVAAHPDDEVLGCGGTIAHHTAAGEKVSILLFADGISSRAEAGSDAIEERQSAARAAAKALGAEAPRFLGLPDNRLDTVPLLDVVKKVETVINEINPAVIYTHHGGDLNIDHRIASDVVLTAARPLPGAPVRAIYAFETVSSTEWAQPPDGSGFRPTRFVDISAHLAAKKAALECYAEELRPFPHPRSHEALEVLARWRGASAGLEAAEAFEVVREIV